MRDLLKMLLGCAFYAVPAGLYLAAAPPQAPPLKVVRQAPPCHGDCGCSVTGRCACGPDCACPACQRPVTKRADDGGPDWEWDWKRGAWTRPAPAAQPAPYGFNSGPMYFPQGFGYPAPAGGVCVGGT